MNETLLSIEDLKVHFDLSHRGLVARALGREHERIVKAVDGITLDIRKGETLGLVGESGCGKSTTGRAILQLIRPTSGRVVYQGTDLATLSESRRSCARIGKQCSQRAGSNCGGICQQHRVNPCCERHQLSANTFAR